MSTEQQNREGYLRRILFGVITLCPLLLIIICIALVYQKSLPGEDLKWIIGVCLTFSILGFTVDRLISFKGFGIEARLAELHDATQKAYASVAEMHQVQQQIRNLAEHLALQQALVVMKTNRFVGDDYLSERIQAIGDLKKILEEIKASKEGIEKMLNVAAPYIRRDLTMDAREAMWKAIQTSLDERVAEIKRDPNRFQREFYEKFVKGYQVNLTFEQVKNYLVEHGIKVTEDVIRAFSRLDAFLGDGRFLNLAGEYLLTVPNPQA